ncbi:MAG: hypothetical protein H6581_14725 [Bacteroidia bacterium]|nr:hypothetical protein [Bacteroidia bacterium]
MILDALGRAGVFFLIINRKWIDFLVEIKIDIFVMSDIDNLTITKRIKGVKTEVLTGFGKEIYYLENTDGCRFNPINNKMVPKDEGGFGLEKLTDGFLYDIKLK